MSPAEKAWQTAVDASRVLTRVEARLVEAGAITELRQFHGLGSDEIDELLWQERNAS